MGSDYKFVPFAVESFGSMGEEALLLTSRLGKLVAEATDEPRSKDFLFQKISIAMQRGNALYVMGTFPFAKGMDEVFYLLK